MLRLVTVVEAPAHLSKAQRITTDAEIAEVVSTNAEAPRAGVVMRGTGGLRKLRIGLEGSGKRGGGQVIYWFHSETHPAVFLWVFAKNEADDLTAEQRAKLSKAAQALLAEFGGER